MRWVFMVRPQSSLYDPALPADPMRSLNRSVSATKCFHERICQACRRKVGVWGRERPADGPLMRCPHRDAELGISEAGGIGTTPVILAPVIGPTARCGVLWLEHAELIALRNQHASRLPVTVKAGVQDWWVSLEQLQWRDWYNPPSE